MMPVRCKGLDCWADSYRVQPSARGYGETVVLLSLFGNHNAVRACWATLASKRNVYPGVTVGGDTDSIRLDKETRYCSLRRPIGEQLLHMVVLHPAATAQASPFGDAFYSIGDAADTFFTRLSRQCPVPLQPAWQADCWRLGLAAGHIAAVDGFGIPVYRIGTTADEWAPTIGQALRDGVLR